MKNKIQKLVLAAILLTALSGCWSKKHQSESQLPWAKPASWQNQTPGISY